jgi:uncharacterized protein
MEPRLILCDGYNIIRTMPGLAAAERQSLEGGREALLGRLTATYRHTPHRVVVVFDGDGPGETRQPIGRWGRGQVVFSQQGESADGVIQRLAREERERGGTVQVISDDFAVRTAVAGSGGQAALVADLERALNAAPRHHAKLAKTREYVRRQLEGTDEDERPDRRKGNPRRVPRRRR